MADNLCDLDVPGTEQLVDVNHNLEAALADENGGIVLIPQPTTAGLDPLTWSSPKKYYHLFLLALYACAFSYGENTLGAAWTTVSDDTGVSLTYMNGGSALAYLLMGCFNLFWIPMALKIGRRPVLLASTIVFLSSAIWVGRFNGTAQWMLSMVLNGIGCAPYQSVIQLSIFDMFYVHERGRMLSFYLFGQQLGSILGLITGGSIADGPGWRWAQYIVTIINGGVLLILFFSFEETLFPRFLFDKISGVPPPSDPVLESKLKDIKDPTDTLAATESTNDGEFDDHELAARFPKRTYLQKLKLWVYYPENQTSFWQYFLRPFYLFLFPNVVIAGIIFAFGCTAGIVSFNTVSEILTEAPYSWSTTSTGLVFLAGLVGSFVGWATGVLSDYIVIFLARRNRGVKEPEMRLWALCFCFLYAAVGYQIYGWGAEFGKHWMTVAFGIGCMIAHQVSACSIATTYAMDCFPGIGGELVVVLAICSSCINFAFSYSVQPFIETAGYGYTFLFFGLCVLGSMVAAIPTYIFGKRWRRIAAPRWRKWLEETQE
ncbi:major facilitator superfamily domain-containing protein [Aspergillus varians]